MNGRAHEVWHDPAVAVACKEAWRASGERAHRDNLGNLCREHIQPPMTVLDAGCGTGLVFAQLVPSLIPADAYTGIDIAGPMLEIARRDFPAGRFEHGDLYDLHFADGSFDAVVCFEVLGHLPDICGALAEMIRVARSVVLFTVWPADGGVAEEAEETGERRALHRRFPEDYVTAEISRAAPGLDLSVTVTGLGAYHGFAVVKP